MTPISLRQLVLATMIVLFSACGKTPASGSGAPNAAGANKDLQQNQPAVTCPAGFFERGPSLVTVTGNRLLTLLTGSDCQVYYTMRETDGTQSGYALAAAGAVMSSPSAISVHGTVIYFVLGTDQHLHFSVWTGSQFLPYRQLGNGVFQESPAATVAALAPAPGAYPTAHIELVAKGTDSLLRLLDVSLNGAILGTQVIPTGAALGSPTASSNPFSSSIFIAFRGTDNLIYRIVCTLGATCQGYGVAFPTTIARGSPAITESGAIPISFLGTDGQIYQGTASGSSVSLTAAGVFKSSPALISGTPWGMVMEAIGTDDQLYFSRFDVNGWRPWTVAVSGPVQAGGHAASLPQLATEIQTSISALHGYQAGCDAAHVTSQDCLTAVAQYCQAHGYASGFGPLEGDSTNATIACFSSAAIARRDTTFTSLHGIWSSCQNSSSESCHVAASLSCVLYGNYSNGGFISFVNGDNAATYCTLSGSGDRQFKSLSEMPIYHSGCNAANPDAFACRAAYRRYCQALGFATGFGVLDRVSSGVEGACVQAF